jgi:plastocyanin
VKRAIVLLLLWVRCAGAATVIGNVVLVNEDGTSAKKPDNSGVVVWLEPVGGAPLLPPSSSRTITMDQRNSAFIPHVLAVQVGTAVDFPNSDAIVHNAFSNFDGQVFDLHLYEPRTSRRVVFRRPGMVRVFCNVHEEMSAVIAVLPSPYFGVTGMDGRFQIQAPAGNYRLQVWHERGQPELLAGLEQRIAVVAEDVKLTEIQIRAGAIQGAHKNKYGQDYFSAPSAHVYIPGGRR